MDSKKTERPLDPHSDNPSLNEELHADTEINSSVTPEDYPAKKRKEQVEAATGGGTGRKP
ncbi:MAG: hypothetical protein JF593_12980 [Novosphingobium sp.]|nr:hypothetical protein [Novosphingobium sp.]